MPVVVKGKNVEIMPALRSAAVRKAARLARYFDSRDAVRVEIAVGLLRGQYTAEVTLQLGGVFLRGVGRAAEALAAIDDAVDRAERQYLRFKSRLEPARAAATVRSPGSGEGEQAPARKTEPAAEAGEESTPRVVRVKRFALKPMSADEAILQMEMLGHDFFVFTNAATDEVNVLYRRRDGNYGLIEPGG